MDKISFKSYINYIDDKKLTKTRRKMNKKSHKGRWYGGGLNGSHSGSSGDGGGMGESVNSLLSEMRAGVIPGAFTANVLSAVQVNKHGNEEEQETTPKIDKARTLFKSLVNQPDSVRADIINAFISQLGITQSTAVSYYDRIARELGLSAKDVSSSGSPNQSSMTPSHTQQTPSAETLRDIPNIEIPDETPADELGDTEEGVIRTVKDAHLVYKRKNEEGTFDELWIYNISNDMKDELKIRRAILAGTDIPPKKTKSEDKTQSYSLTTLGNAQLLYITGLPS